MRSSSSGASYGIRNSSRSGSRNPSYGGGGVRRTPDRYDFSRSSAASYASSGDGRRWASGVKGFARSIVGAIGSCFGSSETRSPTEGGGVSEDFKASPAASDSSSRSGMRRSSRGHRAIYSSHNSTQAEPGSVKFTMAEIYKATRNFSPNFKIGQGGFGTVYKGRLEDGTVVAIKRAKKNMYDKHLSVEFQSEVRTLARVEHLNLVRCLGYLEEEGERVIVVEYVPNGTLREHLDGMYGDTIDLAARLDIAIDVAHAITYLHMYTGMISEFAYSIWQGAIKNFTKGDAIVTLDPNLPRTSATNLALEKVLELSLQCLASTRHGRPSMRRCAEILWSIRKDYRELLPMDHRPIQRSYSQRNSPIKEE
ncbi:Calmodulin-binding receptor-like cytoplasmic kinase 2 [Acorus gramineus]|uniref:Calmodulin-binding receptor-like cytoplasmic kinase 2 n=1 Tax=Acorus gramineus TaxID=55184 RepID=A0AAV9ATF5_ACOGR|nr:Calmodulin-binding receptor-like cytoplasmic kinase 2 [Acorus gramineus]